MNKILVLSTILFSTVLSGQIPMNGLVAWYPFDGNANDTSGNNYHASVINATLTSDRNGNAGRAYHFDGSQQQYIEVPFITPFIANAHTVSAWFRTTQTSGIGRLVVSPMGGGQHFSLNINSPVNNKVNIYSDCAYSYFSVSDTSDINNGNWHHVVGIIDSAGNNMRIYVDGILQNSLTTGFASSFNCYPIQNLNIGRFPGYGEYYTGDLDEILIYNRALDSVEVSALYASFTTGNTILHQTPEVLNVYPSPANDKIKISLTEASDVEVLMIYDVKGIPVFTYQLKDVAGPFEYEINLAGLSPGLYYISAGSKGKMFVKE